jgi:hypothetical protein
VGWGFTNQLLYLLGPASLTTVFAAIIRDIEGDRPGQNCRLVGNSGEKSRGCKLDGLYAGRVKAVVGCLGYRNPLYSENFLSGKIGEASRSK